MSKDSSYIQHQGQIEQLYLPALWQDVPLRSATTPEIEPSRGQDFLKRGQQDMTGRSGRTM